MIRLFKSNPTKQINPKTPDTCHPMMTTQLLRTTIRNENELQNSIEKT